VRRATRLAAAFAAAAFALICPLSVGGLAAAPVASPAAAGPADLVAAYPAELSRIENGELVWKDGVRMPIRAQPPGRPYEQRLATPDIADMFSIAYPRGAPTGPPAVDDDPGRIRYEPFFRKMYGDCAKGDVTPRLRRVAWMPARHGGFVEITTVNGVDKQLEAVVRDLETLPAAMTRYLVPSGGTYNCRAIAGTDRRSMHAYGAAIDISTKTTDYWLWTRPKGSGPIPYRNQVPYQIVQIFERHGFIWGGKWYHYDTMHFEYRPELLPAP
jgi:D-alanyl-D-alanine carboxypeptidase